MFCISKKYFKYLLVAILLTATNNLMLGKIINVGSKGKINSLSKAVEIASPYDKIIIEKGVYNENNVVITKPLEIEGRDLPVIDANNFQATDVETTGWVVSTAKGEGRNSSVINIKSDNVSIEGIKIINVPTSFIKENSAVLVDNVRNCRIARNVFENNFFAVYVSHSSDCKIENNRITGRHSTSESNSGNGIHLWYSKNITITNNFIRRQRDGLYLEFSENAIIKNNVSKNNLRYGLHFMFSHNCLYESNQFISNGGGVAVMYSKNVEMIGNKFLNNWGSASYGLLIKDIEDSRIENNLFKQNSCGILIENSCRNKIERNELRENGWAVKLNSNSMDNVFAANNFVGNTFDIATKGRQDYNRFSGNYWSGYSGYDLNKDGVGDVPYRPVKLFSAIVQNNSPALILLRSLFVNLMEVAEQVLPALTPESLVDKKPAMILIKN